MHLLYLLLLQIMGGYQQHVFNIEPVITFQASFPITFLAPFSYPHTLDLNIDAVNGEPPLTFFPRGI